MAFRQELSDLIIWNKELYGVVLVLCNVGTIYDEDIDVEITIPKDRYISVDKLSVPTEEIIPPEYDIES